MAWNGWRPCGGISGRHQAEYAVFGRICGIQLVSYYDPAASETGFTTVPSEKLLQDVARFERAVRFDTIPLRLTPLEIASHDDNPKVNPARLNLYELPAPPPGEAPREPNPFLVSRDEILSKVHRVALASLSTGKFKLEPEAQGRYLALMRAEIAKLGWQIVDVPNAREVFDAQLKDLEELVDPYTGKRNDEALKQVRKSIFAKLAVDPPVDAILWPSLTKSRAAHENGDAQWDGVSQNARDLGPAHTGFFKNYGQIALGEGSLGAVSLAVRLADADDRSLYAARGGIQLTQQFNNKEIEDLAPQELFRDQTREPLAVHAALRALVLNPEELDAELHPGKKRDKKKK